MPHLTRNIPTKTFYFAFGVEITNKCKTFSKTFENLISRMFKVVISMLYGDGKDINVT